MLKRLSILILLLAFLPGCIVETPVGSGEQPSQEPLSSDDPHSSEDPQASEEPQPSDESSSPEADKGYDYVFDVEAVPRLTIEVSQEQWNALLKAYDANPSTREYVHCDVTFIKNNRRSVVKDAGLRLRGQTSRRRPEGEAGQEHGTRDYRRVHFGLHFRKFHKKDDRYDLEGVHRINLKYAKEDPTYIREHYCYDLLDRLGIWTTQRTSWCRLYLHIDGDAEPVYLGVYLMMEAVNDEYLKERPFRSAKGYLWKGSWGSNLRDTDDWRFGEGEKADGQYAYELKTREDELSKAKVQIKSFIDNLRTLNGSEFESWIKQHCDVDLLLRTYAALVALGHWDDYWNDMNNYYLYFDSTDPSDYKVYMVPYDLDNTLGTSHNCGVQHDSGRHDPFKWGIDECIFISKLLTVNEFRNAYKAYLKTIAAEGSDFLYDASVERIRTWQSMLQPYIVNDTGEDCSIRDYPASWSNHQEYRLLEDSPSTNWFRVKCGVLNAL